MSKKGKAVVGAPQNVTRVGSNVDDEYSDRRAWYKKYRSNTSGSNGSATNDSSRGLSPSRAASVDASDTIKSQNFDASRMTKSMAKIEMAKSCLSHPDLGAQEHGLKVLVNLSRNDSNLPLMRGTVPHLVTLMVSESPVVQMFAAYALAYIALLPSNQDVLRHEGAIAKAVLRLDVSNNEVLEKILWLLRNVSKHGHNREIIVAQGGVVLLMRLALHQATSVSFQACHILRNLFFELKTQQEFVRRGGIDVLTKMQMNRKMTSALSEEMMVEWTNLVCILTYYRYFLLDLSTQSLICI